MTISLGYGVDRPAGASGSGRGVPSLIAMKISVTLVPFFFAALSGCADPGELTATGDARQALTSSLGVPIADFNGDGFADLVVGVPNDDIPTPKGLMGDAGSIHVFYGNGVGLSTANDVIFTQESVDMPGEAGVAHHFGAAVVAGDFNGDHVSDLAIGAPGETVDGIPEAGTVTILYGRVGVGLTTALAEVLTVDSADLSSTKQDHFGSVLAAGDVNGDGRDELAIGIPELDPNLFGHVHVDQGFVVVTGHGRGESTFTEFVVLDGEGTPAWQVRDEHFGGALAFLDVQGDGLMDLAVGAPRGRFPNPEGVHASDAGFVAIYHAHPNLTLGFEEPELYHQANWNNEEPGTAEDGDRFGAALAAGDFNGDGRTDLAVGVPGEDWSGDDAGGVNILYNVGQSLHSEKNEFFSQAAVAVEGAAEGGDRFGSALCAADFDGDGYADLAVGVPGEKEGGVAKAGAVNLLYGRNTGLSAAGDKFFAQSYQGLSGVPRPGEAFGSSLARGDFNTDGVADLVVGIPLDIVTALAGPVGTVDIPAGTIEILFGSPDVGLLTTGEIEINRQTSGVADVSEPGDTFGASLGGG